MIAALARHHVGGAGAPLPLPATPPAPRPGLHIHRNRLPQPWQWLEALYAQLALAAGDVPTARDLAYLPVLEARHGTRGWQATRTAIERQAADMRR